VRKRLGRPSPATLISVLALFVALGGTGYAAVKINGKNIKNNSIAGKKVKRNTLGSREINEEKLREIREAEFADAAGNASSLGGKGATSYLAYGGPVPSGRTITGGWSCQEFDNDTDVGNTPNPAATSCSDVVGLQLPSSVALPEEQVNVTSTPFQDLLALDGDATCTGSGADPTAPRGKVCIYPVSKLGVASLNISGGEVGQDGNKYAFRVVVSAPPATSSLGAYGTWAFTAP
jgi:hypothetical protein